MRERLSEQTLRRIGYTVIALSAAMAVIHGSLAFQDRDVADVASTVVIAGAFLSVAGLALRTQPRNGAVWTLIWAMFFGVLGVTMDRMVPAIEGVSFIELEGVDPLLSPSDLSFVGALAVSVSYWAWVPAAFLLTNHLLITFPVGRATSRRWRYAAWGSALSMILLALSATVRLAPWVETPYHALIEDEMAFHAAISGVMLIPLALTPVSLVGLVTRYRRSSGEERQQYRVLMWAVGTYALVSIGLYSVVSNFGDGARLLLGTLPLAGIPVAFGIAILKYRLYEIDVVISRSLVYGALAALIGGVYVALVVGVGALIGAGNEPNAALVITATAVVAVIFEPARTAMQRWANRLVYGERATPYEVLSDLTAQLANAEAGEGVLERMAQRLAEGTGAERATVWTADSGGFEAAASAPEQPLMPGAAHLSDLPGSVVPVEHEGEVLGALSVEKPRGETLTSTEERLVHDLAGSAGLLLQRQRLDRALAARAAELQASRRRLVDAQDVERRKLERDLHDGAQQQVVALKVKLGLVRQLAATEGASHATALIDEMEGEAQEAIERIRSLAQGIYPPLLEADGLAAAIPALAALSPLDVTADVASGDRLPLPIEGAVYFCVAEALTNAAKHARGPVTVSISRSDDAIEFEVVDDGPGFDAVTARRGAGLSNMADRLEALGGSLDVSSSEGDRTTVRGRLPVAVREVVTT